MGELKSIDNKMMPELHLLLETSMRAYGEEVMVLCNSRYPKPDSIGLVLNIDVGQA